VPVIKQTTRQENKNIWQQISSIDRLSVLSTRKQLKD
jgi:hypothetical protein